MQDEIKSLKALGTWSYVVVDNKQKKKALPVKWVYKIMIHVALKIWIRRGAV
jgi:hypothetical protein